MPEEMTKELLLQEIRKGRASLEAALGRLSPDQMERLLGSDGWTVKDVLAHLAWWEEHMAGWLEVGLRGAAPEVPAPGMSWDDVDRLNEENLESSRDLSLSAVQAGLRDAQAHAMAALEAAPEAALIDPHFFAWRKEVPMWNMVAACSYRHYAEHAETIASAAQL